MGTRFNLILEDRQYRTLTVESERQSVSVAELIRRSIDAAFSLDDRRRVPGVELSVSVWRRPDGAVAGRRPGIRLPR
jgi:hypothetical protein